MNTDHETEVPTAFISYSWDGPDHKEWVAKLGERLRLDGINIMLDQWEMAPGDRLPHFMESGIRDNDFVLSICTSEYKKRFDSRERGVGDEADLITARAGEEKNNRAIIPIWRSDPWEDAAPTRLVDKVRIDLRGDPYDESKYQELVKALRGENPRPPQLGPKSSKPIEQNTAESVGYVRRSTSDADTITVEVRKRKSPVAGADLLVLFPNNTWKQERTDMAGQVRLYLHTLDEPLTVFAAADGCAAHAQHNWIPNDGALIIELSNLPDGGSIVIPNGTGYIPGLAGRLNPILDSNDRTYMYADNVAIGGGQNQPVTFVPRDEELHLMDANGIEKFARVVAITGRSSLIEYRAV